ncbi:hypothetical protein [Phocaeicola sp.]
MNEKKMEKGSYEAPVIKKQQVILEQAIAGSRPISSDYGHYCMNGLMRRLMII